MNNYFYISNYYDKAVFEISFYCKTYLQFDSSFSIEQVTKYGNSYQCEHNNNLKTAAVVSHLGSAWAQGFDKNDGYPYLVDMYW